LKELVFLRNNKKYFIFCIAQITFVKKYIISMDTPVKKKNQPNQISLNSENSEVVNKTLRIWKEYAEKNGYDSVKKKDVINAMIRVAGDIDAKQFYESYEKVSFCFTTTAAINGANQQLIIRNFDIVSEYADRNGIKPKPTQKDVFNYMIKKGSDITPENYFHNKI
jgi:hypothetical protein